MLYYIVCVCVVCVLCVLFFVQAEDGIRDLVRSRGLGDVYKRQMLLASLERTAASGVPGVPSTRRSDNSAVPRWRATVSYTHLTLPTSDLV